MSDVQAATGPSPGLKPRDTRFSNEFLPHCQAAAVWYCWMKIVKKHDFSAKSNPRPPNAFTRFQASGAPAPTPSAGGDLDVFYAVPGLWNVGSSNRWIDYGPAFASFGEALDWYSEEPAGVAWRSVGEAFNLIAFARLTQFDGTRMAAAPACGPGGFPPGDWMPVYSAQLDVKIEPVERVWDETILSELLDGDWDRLSKDPSAECQALGELVVRERKRTRIDEIKEEAGGFDAIGRKLLDAVGKKGATSSAAWIKLSLLLPPAFEPILYRIKCRYNRFRPRHACPDAAQPMFEPPDPLHPGHPSFPGGHAVTTSMLAVVLDEIFPGHTRSLEKAADRIIENREVAGLHFRSDSEAGRKLGTEMAKMLLNLDPTPDGNAQMGANRAYLRGLFAKL